MKKPSHKKTRPIPGEYYHRLVNDSSYAIIGTDCDGIVVSWNAMAERIFNTEASQILGGHIDRIIPDNQRNLVRKLIEKTIVHRQVNEFEIEHVDKNGNKNTLTIAITPIVGRNDQSLGLAAWVRDITNRKTLQQQLAESEKMASLGTLASGVAHHFNNILGGVLTMVDLALQSNDPVTIARALKMTSEATAKMGTITHSLLTFAEKDIGKFDLTDLTEIILTFAHSAEQDLNQLGISLKLHLQAVGIVEVVGSRMLLLLNNLLDNAKAAMAEGGTFTVTLEQSNGYVVLCINDTGVGIQKEDMPHIFEPFYTTHGFDSLTPKYAQGLGLSVVYGIVKELKGTIETTSTPNQGCTFKIQIPVK